MSRRLPTKQDFPPTLTLDIIPPPSGSPPINILILLHGLGDTQTSFTTLAQNLNLAETACISLRGPNPIPSLFTGSDDPAFHWGDDVLIDERKGEIELDAGFKTTGVVVGESVVSKVLIEKCGYQARDIIFLGFGQGAMAALSVDTSQSKLEFGGIISIGGTLPASTAVPSPKSQTPVLVLGGSRSTEVTRSRLDRLKEAFVNVEYVKWAKPSDSMPGSREEMLPIMRFLARRLRSRAGVPEGALEI